MGVPTLEAAISSGDRFSIQAAAKADAEKAYSKGYLEGVQDQQAVMRYVLDTGPLTTPIAWFRFYDDAKLAKAVLSTAWDDLRIVELATGESK